MAKQTINIGTSANKGDGDPLRTAFTKINANFTEVYAATDIIKLKVYADSQERDIAIPSPVTGTLVMVGANTQIFDGTAWQTLAYL